MPKKEHRKAVSSELSAVGSPERSCIVTRRVLGKEELIRFVLSPEGVLTPDLAYKLPGRGMYVSVSKLLLAEAIAKRAFNRAAGQQVRIPDGLIANVEAQLQRRVADALSLARKAGQVITGFEKVDKALKNGKVVALIHASDAGDDGVRKLTWGNRNDSENVQKEQLGASSPARGEGVPPVTLSELLDAEEEDGFEQDARPKTNIPTFRELPREVISGVLGRENAVHVAITQGSAAAFFIAEARRFALFLQ